MRREPGHRQPLIPGPDAQRRGVRTARTALLISLALVVVKLVAGLLGNAFVLVADAIESATDVLASVIVLGGVSYAAQPADEHHPFGHGKAEPLVAAAVALLLLGAAMMITIVAVAGIRGPVSVPAPFTLWVAGGAIIVKWALAVRVRRVSEELGSHALHADAWHHAADAITSAAAFAGIALALWGTRTGRGDAWAAADDWAALVAAGVVAVNAVLLLRPAIDHLMDRAPDKSLIGLISATALGVTGVLAIEQVRVRRSGAHYWVDLHVQAEPTLSLHDAHILSGQVKSAIRAAAPRVAGVLVHMEPYEGKVRTAD